MKYRFLGKLPIRVSEIGLGTAQLANTSGRSPGVQFIPPQVARGILAAALDEGVNFFDTADRYGDAEMLLGECSTTTKSRITVATKAGLRPDGMRDFSENHLRSSVDQSLKRLRVDRIDLFQLNKPAEADLRDGRIFALLENLKLSGKIRYAGIVVGETSAGFLSVDSGTVDTLQVLYNLLYQDTYQLIRCAGERGLGVVVRSPLNSGVLSGTYTSSTVFPAGDERSQYFSGVSFQTRLSLLGEIQDALHVDNENLLEFSLRFVLSCPHVSVIIPGASSMGQAVRYAKCSDLPKFGESELEHIKSAVASRLSHRNQVFQS